MTGHASYPIIRLLPQRHKRVAAGHPWVYSNEIAMDDAARALPSGSVVHVRASSGQALGTAFFNPHTLIAGRMLSPHADVSIDVSFFAERLRQALALREKFFDKPFYRLVHAEADGLPGVIIDRYGSTLVIQANTVGMEQHMELLLAAAQDVLKPQAIVLRNDSPTRGLEGLEQQVRVVEGTVGQTSTVEENGAVFVTSLTDGQKTGWFYDHRDNRAFMARLAPGARLLDVYTYAGGFGVLCAKAGAASVLAVDRSQFSLDLAAQSAQLNQVDSRCQFQRGDAFDVLEKLKSEKRLFDVVIADPPAFVKSRKDLGAGTRAYRKLARLSAAVTAPGGFLLIASCSHNMSPENFSETVAQGLSDAGRTGRIVRVSGAGPDHPVHPLLPETAYLKAMVIQLL